jgi:ribosomal protein S18 acetylase RimI-like enzyme
VRDFLQAGPVDLGACGKGRGRAERPHRLRPEKAWNHSDGRGFNSPHLHPVLPEHRLRQSSRCRTLWLEGPESCEVSRGSGPSCDAGVMTEHGEIAIVRWLGRTGRLEQGLAALLTDYHLQTETEKGGVVADAAALPARYRAEISAPRIAFVDDVVLVALSGRSAVGCVVLTAARDGLSEVKRLWTDPAHRGRGVASGLLEAALAHAARRDASTVRLSVWSWRTGAIALYKRLGFTVAESWDRRDQLVCMRRIV